MKQIYCLFSANAHWLTQQRNDLVAELVPAEMRDENLREWYSSTNSPLRLEDILPEILGELSTIPFLPDSRRVLVVHDLGDFLSGGSLSRSAAKKAGKKKQADKKPKKLTAAEAFMAFVEKDLPATENVVIFSTLIDQSRGHYIDAKNKFYEFMQRNPRAQILRPAKAETDPLFLMTDALLERNAIKCLQHFRSIYRDDGRHRVFNALLRDVRFLIQAKIMEKIESQREKSSLISSYLPEDKRLSLQMQPSYAQGKYLKNRHRFEIRELMTAMERLLEINRHLYPSSNTLYVPDAQFLFETFIMELCAQ